MFITRKLDLLPLTLHHGLMLINDDCLSGIPLNPEWKENLDQVSVSRVHARG